jgi:hypothetical protein
MRLARRIPWGVTIMDKLTLVFLDDVLDLYLQEHGLRETIHLGDLPLRARSEVLERAAQLAQSKKGKPSCNARASIPS